MTPIQLIVLNSFLPYLFGKGVEQGGMFSDSGSLSTGKMEKQREDVDF